MNRTTSPLESLNSILNRSIAKKTHFFRFVARLKVFESKKSHDMNLAVNSKLPQKSSGNRKYQIRNKKIKELTDMFDGGSIDVEVFLDSMASDQYRMCNLILFVLNSKNTMTLTTIYSFTYKVKSMATMTLNWILKMKTTMKTKIWTKVKAKMNRTNMKMKQND